MNENTKSFRTFTDIGTSKVFYVKKVVPRLHISYIRPLQGKDFIPVHQPTGFLHLLWSCKESKRKPQFMDIRKRVP
jgi:hypothetical protein